jgi:hypothetical protein
VPLKLLQVCVESAQQKDGKMKARFTDEQIIGMIKEQESGEKTADERCRMDLTPLIPVAACILEDAVNAAQIQR